MSACYHKMSQLDSGKDYSRGWSLAQLLDEVKATLKKFVKIWNHGGKFEKKKFYEFFGYVLERQKKGSCGLKFWIMTRQVETISDARRTSSFRANIEIGSNPVRAQRTSESPAVSPLDGLTPFKVNCFELRVLTWIKTAGIWKARMAEAGKRIWTAHRFRKEFVDVSLARNFWHDSFFVIITEKKIWLEGWKLVKILPNGPAQFVVVHCWSFFLATPAKKWVKDGLKWYFRLKKNEQMMQSCALHRQFSVKKLTYSRATSSGSKSLNSPSWPCRVHEIIFLLSGLSSSCLKNCQSCTPPRLCAGTGSSFFSSFWLCSVEAELFLADAELAAWGMAELLVPGVFERSFDASVKSKGIGSWNL